MDKKDIKKLEEQAKRYEELIKKKNKYKKEKYLQKVVLVKKEDLDKLIIKLKNKIKDADDEVLKEYASYLLMQMKISKKIKNLEDKLKD